MSIDDFHVVANGRDERVFHPFDSNTRAGVRGQLDIPESAPLLVYAGSLGPQYRPDAMRRVFAEIRCLRADARLLVLTGSPELGAEAFGTEAGAIVLRAEPGEVARFLAAADVGLAYRSKSFSMQAVAPVKLAEYLLCGLPVIGTAGVGDTGDVLAKGLFHDGEAGAEAAARWFVEQVLPHRQRYRSEARAAGVAQFSLARSIEDYERALEPFRRAAPGR